MSLFTMTLLLLLIMDPIGNLYSYLSLVKELNPQRQKWVIFREMGIALLAMLGFYYLGEFLFDFLNLSECTLRLASGVILFLIAIKVLFSAPDSPRAHLEQGEPFIFPFAIPLIAGPALLATIMLYSHIEKSQSEMLLAILIAWFLSVVILFFSRPIYSLLGKSGLMAGERLIGMVLVLIAVQAFLQGILTCWKMQPHA